MLIAYDLGTFSKKKKNSDIVDVANHYHMLTFYGYSDI